MKNLCTTVLGTCLMLISIGSFAQNQEVPVNEPDYNKPKLFNDLPESIAFDPATLQYLFQLQVGQTTSIPMTANFSFRGDVVSKSSEENMQSIVIRSTNRPGARLVFTKIIDPENGVKYIGRIISFQHGDAFEIVFENNQYTFKKKGLYDLFNE
jgi:hypothetical protein